MKAIKNFKRGDTMLLTVTYKVDGIPTSISTIDIASQIRTQYGTLIDSMIVTKSGSSTGVFTLAPSDSDTSAWPLGNLLCDIEFTQSGNIRSTETFGIVVVEEITK